MCYTRYCLLLTFGYLSAQSYGYNAYAIRDAEDLNLIGEYIGLALQRAWSGK